MSSFDYRRPASLDEALALLQSPEARALLLFPTKALCQDQYKSFARTLEAAGLGYRAKEQGLRLALEIPLPASDILPAFSRFDSFEYQVCFDLGNASAMGPAR